MMKIGVFGLGYVGTVTATILANEGHQVVGVDTNTAKVSMIRRGQSPILEPGVAERMAEAVKTGSLSVTMDPYEAVIDSDVVFLCVGTPARGNGQLDISALRKVVSEVGAHIAKCSQYLVVAIRSTVLPHLIQEVLIPDMADVCGKWPGQAYGVVANPEFLREGSGVGDFLNPPFTLIGELDKRSGNLVEELYCFIDAPIIRTNIAEAMMVKYASNAFHGMKVAFANEIGLICRREGIDSHRVMDIFCRDEKLNLSARYLRPGFAFGGSCLPKDLQSLTYHARREDCPLALLEAVLQSNQAYLQRCIEMVLGTKKQRVGVFGIGFKPGTDDLRESPMISLIESLIGKGLQVSVYDSHVSLARLLGSNREYLNQRIPHIASLLKPSMEEVITLADVLVVANKEPEFTRLPEIMRNDQILIDFNTVIPADSR